MQQTSRYCVIGGTRYAEPPIIDLCPNCGEEGTVSVVRAVLDPRTGDTLLSCMLSYPHLASSPIHPGRVQHFCYSCAECLYTWWEIDPLVVSNLRKDHKKQREQLRNQQTFQMKCATRLLEGGAA